MVLLLEHFKAMQDMASKWLEPADGWTDRDGRFWRDENGIDGFVGDLIYMLDGPEQRAAQAEAEQLVEQPAYPTEDAYMAACRALHWATALLRHHGVEPVDLSRVENLTHYPPEDYDFGPSLKVEREEAAEWRMDIRRQVEQADAIAKGAREHAAAMEKRSYDLAVENNDLRSRLMNSEMVYAQLRGYLEGKLDSEPAPMVPAQREPFHARMPDASGGAASQRMWGDGRRDQLKSWYHR